MHCFHENWVIKNAFSLKKGRIGLEKPETLVLIVTSSVIDKKLEIYKNLEIELEIDRNLENKLKIYSYFKQGCIAANSLVEVDN